MQKFKLSSKGTKFFLKSLIANYSDSRRNILFASSLKFSSKPVICKSNISALPKDKKRSPKILAKPYKLPQIITNNPSFVNSTFPDKEEKVSAYFLAKEIDLIGLNKSLQSKKCFVFAKESFLVTESSLYFRQQRCSAVVFRNGCIVLWGMSEKTEKLFFEVLSDYRKDFTKDDLESEYVGETEDFDFIDTNRKSYIDDLGIHITTSETRTSDIISLSHALMNAVRLNVIEKKIEAQLHDKQIIMERLQKEILMSKNLRYFFYDHRSKDFFICMSTLHQLRYELNVQMDLHEIPDILWSYEPQERLYVKLQKGLDFRRRIDMLNNRLTWIFDYVDTLAEYVDRKNSSRLETIIIVLIFWELLLGISQTFRESNR